MFRKISFFEGENIVSVRSLKRGASDKTGAPPKITVARVRRAVVVSSSTMIALGILILNNWGIIAHATVGVPRAFFWPSSLKKLDTAVAPKKSVVEKKESYFCASMKNPTAYARIS